MPRPVLPLNAFRAFEAAARQGSLTRAAVELCVTQAAVSHHVKSLEELLGAALFKRVPKGVILTAEGEALLSPLTAAFDTIAATVDRLKDGRVREVLTVGVVGTFAVGWLLPRLPQFRERHPHIDFRLSTNNNRVETAAEGLDCAIRFGDGTWHAIHAERLFDAPLSVLCRPELAEALNAPEDVAGQTLLRSYRQDEWTGWFAAAGIAEQPRLNGALTFDSSIAMMEAAIQGAGFALAPPAMFERLLKAGIIVQPFEIYVTRGCYWLTRLQSRSETAAMRQFRSWLMETIGEEARSRNGSLGEVLNDHGFEETAPSA